MNLTAGIDFGTSKSVIAVDTGNSVEVIAGANKERAVPSVVFFDEQGKRLVGREAVTEGRDRPEFCLRHFKRLINQDYRDGEDNGWQSVKGPDGKVWLRGPDRDYSPIELASFVIRELLDAAEFRLRGVRPNQAVITHPANYSTEEKLCVIQAGKLAGLEQVFLLEEPVAAGLAYGLEQQKIRHLGVLDMGAGTSDFTVLHGGLTGGKHYLEPKDSDAIPKGGIDADYEVVEWLLDEWFKEYSSDLGQDGAAVARLREAAEKAKIELSVRDRSDIILPQLEFVPIRSLNKSLTKEHFERMIKPLTDEAIGLVERVLAKTGLTKGNISDWILVGGMTNVPAVRKALADFAGKEPRADIDPDEVVARGAAMHAAANIDKRTKPYSLIKRVGADFGFETLGDVFHKVIKSDDVYPLERTVPIITAEDDQPGLSIHVLEGDGLAASGARRVATADLPAEPAPKGMQRVMVTFKVDESGMKTASHAGGAIYQEVA